MQWFDAISTFVIFGGSVAGFFRMRMTREKHRHEEAMAEGERQHDRYTQKMNAIQRAPNQSTIQRVINAAQDWHDREF